MYMKIRFIVALALLACGSTALAQDWNAAHWETLFKAVPPPPATLADAGKMIGPVMDAHGHPALGIVDPALVKSHADLKAGLNALNQAATQGAAQTTGMDLTRMQSDPSYAEAMQQKMASMSDAEKMQMAMQMSSSFRAQQQTEARNPSGILLMGYITQSQQQTNSLRSHVSRQFIALRDKYNSQHLALDALLQDALKACPPVAQCQGECNPAPACISQLNARLPKVIDQHRQLAAAELADLRKLYAETLAGEQPLVAHLAQLTTQAEASHSNLRNQGYANIAADVGDLQLLVARAALRAGYWENIKQRPIADDYGFSCTLGYAYPLNYDDGACAPPEDVPTSW